MDRELVGVCFFFGTGSPGLSWTRCDRTLFFSDSVHTVRLRHFAVRWPHFI